MTSKKAIKSARANVAKVSTIIIVSHILQNEFFGTKLFSDKWLYSSIAQLAGWVGYSLYIEGKVKCTHKEKKIANAMNTVVMMASVFTITRVIVTGMKNKVDISRSWMENTAKVLAGFALVDLIGDDKLPKWKGHEGTVKDLAYVVSSSVVPQVLSGNKLDKKFWLETGSVAAGFFVYNEYVQKKIFK
tara:strand:+ start:38 stop:601 length:564 start_codon:yes stop_codon:yes gene_type:complete